MLTFQLITVFYAHVTAFQQQVAHAYVPRSQLLMEYFLWLRSTSRLCMKIFSFEQKTNLEETVYAYVQAFHLYLQPREHVGDIPPVSSLQLTAVCIHLHSCDHTAADVPPCTAAFYSVESVPLGAIQVPR